MPLRNRILSRMPRQCLDALAEHSSVVQLDLGRTLWRQDTPIHKVYFPTTAIISLLISSGDTPELELATVGNEGMVGIAGIVDMSRSLGRALVQVSGEALVAPISKFQNLTRSDESLTRLLHRYFYYEVRMVAQSGACHRFHKVEERCARWLLTTQDRAGTDEFGLTQEFLASMMGTARPKVTLALSRLRRQGAIDHKYRRIRIADREQLESLACPCYEALRRLRDSLKL